MGRQWKGRGGGGATGGRKERMKAAEGAVYAIVSCLVRDRVEQREQELDFVLGDWKETKTRWLAERTRAGG
jgi:hypothetical protein